MANPDDPLDRIRAVREAHSDKNYGGIFDKMEGERIEEIAHLSTKHEGLVNKMMTKLGATKQGPTKSSIANLGRSPSHQSDKGFSR